MIVYQSKFKDYFLPIIFGIVFACIGIIPMINHAIIKKDYIKTTATITKIISYYNYDELEHEVYISYEANGDLYDNVEIDVYMSSMKEGNKLTIYYQKDDAMNIFVESSNAIFIVSAIAGMAIVSVFLTAIIIDISKRKAEKKIINDLNSKKFDAKITSVDIDNTYKVNGKPQYFKFTCVFDDCGNKRTIVSPRVSINKSIVNVGDYVDIYQSNENTDKFVIDKNSIKKSTKEERTEIAHENLQIVNDDGSYGKHKNIFKDLLKK